MVRFSSRRWRQAQQPCKTAADAVSRQQHRDSNGASGAEPATEPLSRGVEVVACAATESPSGATQIVSDTGSIVPEQVVIGRSGTVTVTAETDFANVGAAAAVRKDTEETGVVTRSRRRGLRGLSAASPPADAATVAHMPARVSRPAIRRGNCETYCSNSQEPEASRRGSTLRRRRGKVGLQRLPTRRSSRNRSSSLNSRDSSGSDNGNKTCERDSMGTERGEVTGDAAEEEAKPDSACRTARVDGCENEAGDAIAGDRDPLAGDAAHVKKRDRLKLGGKTKGKRKEYQRLKACVKPSVVPVRRAVVTYHLGAYCGRERPTEARGSSNVPPCASGSTATGSEGTVPDSSPQGCAATNAAVSRSLFDFAGGAANGNIQRVPATDGDASFHDTHIRAAAAAAAALSAGAGDEEDETWRGSSRSRAGAAGGRIGRFSEAERAAVYAALQQYAIDNELDGGTVEAAVEHLMSAQDVSSSSSEGKKKRGGRALRFAAITRWLPQRSCASIYLYIRRNLCAHLGTKKCGPWSPEEVSTLLKMEAELRVTQPRRRFALIAAALNRTASCVYDKWKDINPRIIPPAEGTSSRDSGVANQATSSAVVRESGAAVASARLAAGGSDLNACDDAASSANSAVECSAVSTADSTCSSQTRRKCSRGGGAGGGADATQQEYLCAGQPVCEVGIQQSQEQLHRLDSGRSTEVDSGGTDGGERGDSSDDSHTSTTAVEGSTAETTATERGKRSVAYGARRRGRFTGWTRRSEINPMKTTSEGRGRATLSTVGEAGTTLSQEVSDCERMGAHTSVHRGELKDTSPENSLQKAGGTEEGIVPAGTLLVEKRIRFGTKEHILQLLLAIQRQTGERLPATGISWASVQKECFPSIVASRLRLFYTISLVPKELAKRMGVPSAEPVLLRFIVRCLDSLLNAKQQVVSKAAKKSVPSRTTTTDAGVFSVLGPESAGASGVFATQSASHECEDRAAETTSEEGEYSEMSQVQQCTLSGTFIDHVGDVDWLEVLPFCPTALPPHIFRNAVAGLPSAKNGHGNQHPESLQLAQQVLLLKERLRSEGNAKNAGRDAALLLRAALPREVFARAVQHELRRQRWKRMRKEQDKQNRMDRPHVVVGVRGQRQGKGQQQLGTQLEDHRSGWECDDGPSVSTAADDRRELPDALHLRSDTERQQHDADSETSAMQEYEEDAEEEAREEARERGMTQAELEEKWNREEKHLGRTALLALLRRVGGKEIRRLRRRNRRCAPLKEAFASVKGSYHPASSHLSEDIRNNWFGLQSTSAYDEGREDGSTRQSPGRVSSCEAKCQVPAPSTEGQMLQQEALHQQVQLQNILHEGETREPLDVVPNHQQDQEKHGIATSRAASSQRDSHSNAVEEEEQVRPMLPPSGRRRSRAIDNQIGQREITVAEAAAEEERQQANVNSVDTPGPTVKRKVERHVETDTILDATKSRGEPECQVEEETTGVIRAAGHEWQQLDGAANFVPDASGQATNEQGDTEEKSPVPKVVQTVDTEEGSPNIAAQCDMEQSGFNMGREVVCEKEPLAQVDVEGDPESESTSRTDTEPVFVDEEVVRGRKKKRKKKKITSVSNTDTLSGDVLPFFPGVSSALGEEKVSVCDISSNEGRGTSGHPPGRNNTLWKKKKNRDHLGEELLATVATVLVNGHKESGSHNTGALVLGDPVGSSPCKSIRRTDLHAVEASHTLPLNELGAVEGQQEPRKGSDGESLVQEQNQPCCLARSHQHETQELRQQEHSQQGHHAVCREQERQSPLQKEKEKRARQHRHPGQHEVVMCADGWQGEQSMHVEDEKERKKKTHRRKRSLERSERASQNSSEGPAEQCEAVVWHWQRDLDMDMGDEKRQKEKEQEKKKEEEEERKEKKKKKKEKMERRKKKDATRILEGPCEQALQNAAAQGSEGPAEQHEVVERPDGWQGEQSTRMEDERKQKKKEKREKKKKEWKRISDGPSEAAQRAVRRSCEGRAEQDEVVVRANGWQGEEDVRVGDEGKQKKEKERQLSLERPEEAEFVKGTRSEGHAEQHETVLRTVDWQGGQGVDMGYERKQKREEKREKKKVKKQKRKRLSEASDEAASERAAPNSCEGPAEQHETVTRANDCQGEQDIDMGGEKREKKKKKNRMSVGLGDAAFKGAVQNNFELPAQQHEAVIRVGDRQGEQDMRMEDEGKQKRKEKGEEKKKKRKRILEEQGEAGQKAALDSCERPVKQLEAVTRADDWQREQDKQMEDERTQKKKKEKEEKKKEKRKRILEESREAGQSAARDSCEGPAQQPEAVAHADGLHGEQDMDMGDERKQKKEKERQLSLERPSEKEFVKGIRHSSEGPAEQHETMVRAADRQGEQDMRMEDGRKEKQEKREKKKERKLVGEFDEMAPRAARNSFEGSAEQHETVIRTADLQGKQDVRMEDERKDKKETTEKRKKKKKKKRKIVGEFDEMTPRAARNCFEGSAEQHETVIRAGDRQGEQDTLMEDERKEKKGKKKMRRRIQGEPDETAPGAARNSCERAAERLETVVRANGWDGEQDVHIGDEKKQKKKKKKNRQLTLEEPDEAIFEARAGNKLARTGKQLEAVVRPDDWQGEQDTRMEGDVDRREKKKKKKRNRILEWTEVACERGYRNNLKGLPEQREGVVCGDDWQGGPDVCMDREVELTKKKKRKRIVEGPDEAACERAFRNSPERPVQDAGKISLGPI